MKLEIRGQHVEITDSIHEYIERRLAFALDRFAEKIRIVRLRVRDVNGSRGGVDKSCQLGISLTYSAPITVESRDSSIQGAIDRVCGKLSSLLTRHFGRRRKCRRSKRLARELFGSPVFSAGTSLVGGTQS
jgi:putative sigma-54 modulation protein